MRNEPGEFAYGVRYGGVYGSHHGENTAERRSLVVDAYAEREFGVHAHIWVRPRKINLPDYCVVLEAAGGADAMHDTSVRDVNDIARIERREAARPKKTGDDYHQPMFVHV